MRMCEAQEGLWQGASVRGLTRTREQRLKERLQSQVRLSSEAPPHLLYSQNRAIAPGEMRQGNANVHVSLRST
jgi:hypothetical protein